MEISKKLSTFWNSLLPLFSGVEY